MKLKKLRDVLLVNLRKELEDENKKLLMWILETYIYENVTFEAMNHFPHTFVTALVSKLIQPDAWSTPVVLTALRVLTDLSRLYHHLARDNPVHSSSLSLCDYVYIFS
jgi:predicted FMN-binding regulatory protein PaiB